ncbi:DNA-binding death effector domain-containing protein 2 [Pantherophis guttatus]|uniref:DNA-binding death effector domain-containing protein 2 n=1 Tax=Pantherophis guttatus TaxID=94885 RepID=A0A6P9DBS2_PANGU|nr:DNA-binding death effector domain-containing protein 2 [Pantherophis guttatus]XP_034293893.1 DNA-binding death effector domain-containing protein 2 [Pantherophis guttatus]
MADMRRQLFAHIWEEEECLEYYGMVSLHQMFEVIGSQLTENDVEVLSFLLDETQPWTHPLDPALWTVAAEEEGGSELTSPALENWKRKNPCWCNLGRNNSNLEAVAEKWQPKNGVQLLLELERRGKCDETNFVQLLQLLRVLTRHDLLPYVTLKRQRTVSPERYTYGPSVLSADQQMDNCLNSASSEPRHDQWETGSNSSKRKRVSRGRSKATSLCRRRGAKASSAPKQEVPAPTKVTCDIRLRVRAEYCQHEPVLRQNVMSNKQNHLERQFDVFGQSNTILKSRDLGSIICDIKFSELSYLDAFWSDYMNGSLLEALKGVFITDSLKEAVGQEAIRLLVNVDEDDYEEGRRLLLENFSPQVW